MWHKLNQRPTRARWVGAAVFLASVTLAPAAWAKYATQLVISAPATAKPGDSVPVTVTLTGLFKVGFIYPDAPGPGGYIILYQGNAEVGRVQINKSNTQITNQTYDVGPDGRQVIIGLGSRKDVTFTVQVPSTQGGTQYSATFTGDYYANGASAGPTTVRVGYPDITPVIVPLLLDK